MSTLRIGLVGHGFMGRIHSHAWQTVSRAFDLPLDLEQTALAGRDADRVERAARSWGWASAETDWRRLVERDDIDLIDITTPGALHVEIALAALAAGKHVLCEKPLANTLAEAERMTAAAESAARQGIRSMVGFNYRRTPALSLARDMVAEGRLGEIRHVRALYLQDWINDPDFPLVWRLRKEEAGSGALGDLGAHLIDLAAFLTGQRISGLSALTRTFIDERPLAASSSGLAGVGQAERGRVSVDDAAVFFATCEGGAIATFEATRFAPGRKNAMRIELNGSKGSVAFDFESMNELQYYDATAVSTHAGFARILATEPQHPYMEAWWPPGHGLGYDHTFTNQMRDLVMAIASGEPPTPSFADGLYVQRVLNAVETSAQSGSAWEPVANKEETS
ncbi:Gfo/Idh/MocA family protein [Actinospica robiniae]|uniref:Gfo/Idh/MocA family protein n=1 Tax=Actinospica robiniae TaxID=304901 RepID=UPI00040EA973|nr:Gfo/Idh/MocA family oxidoreductase [Actinospica robiniae]